MQNSLRVPPQKAMKKQQKIQPLLAELQKKYANDQLPSQSTTVVSMPAIFTPESDFLSAIGIVAEFPVVAQPVAKRAAAMTVPKMIFFISSPIYIVMSKKT